jgi:hypothetical protein
MRLTSATFQPKRLRLAFAGGLDELLFHPDIDDERATRDSLAITAMAGMDDQRIVGQLVADFSASASAAQILRFSAHDCLL